MRRSPTGSADYRNGFGKIDCYRARFGYLSLRTATFAWHGIVLACLAIDRALLPIVGMTSVCLFLFLFSALPLPFIDFTADVTLVPGSNHSFFWWRVAHLTVLGGEVTRRMCGAVNESNNDGDTCYTINNKNIKRAGNPKGRRVTSK
jgi:hypothetical protein